MKRFLTIKLIRPVLFIITISCNFVSYSQTNTIGIANIAKLNETIIPPSPNAAALGKFGDIPVGLYTGIPKISIPIYQFSNANANLSLNVSLDYHAGGIKTEELSSNIGLGWALSAGGVINRTMRGLPDELPNGFLRTDTLPNLNTYLYTANFLHPTSLTDPTITNATAISAYDVPESQWNLLELANSNSLDIQQDIFSVSCGGINCKFFIGKDGSIIQAEKSNVKIIPISETVPQTGYNPISYFKIIGEDGTIYIFNHKEITQSVTTTVDANGNTNQVTQNPYTSSWYLSEIQSVNHIDKILFNYDYTTMQYTAGQSEFKSINFSNDPSSGTTDQYHVRDHTHSSSLMTINSYRINHIDLPDSTKMLFTYHQSGREDLPFNSAYGDYALDRITIHNGTAEKSFNLYHDYFVSTFNSLTMPNNPDFKRLRLYKVQEFGGNDVKNPYLFYYNTTSLPDRSSYYQDYWGFAIGPDRNALSLIPATYGDSGGDDVAGYYTGASIISEGTYREPDSLYAKAWSLEKIVYPTTGSTTFKMENNTASPNNGSYFRKLSTKQISVSNSQMNQDWDFDLTTVPSGNTKISISITETAPRPEQDPNSPTTIVDGEIDTKPLTLTISNATHTWSATVYSGTYGDCISNTVSPPYGTVNLPGPGHYFVNVQFNSPYNQSFIATIAAGYIATGDRLAGGLRIKQMVDSSGNNYIIKKFNYNDANGHSTGMMGQVPNYNYYFTSQNVAYTINGGSGHAPEYVDILNRSADPTMPLATVQGASVGYLQVAVSNVGTNLSDNTGKVIYSYSPIQYAGFTSVYPFHPGQYIDWSAGLALTEKYLDAYGNMKKLIENTWNVTYAEANSPNYRSIKTGLVLTTSAGTPGTHFYASNTFYPYTGHAEKLKAVETNYETAGTIKDSILYTYDPIYFTIKNIKASNSKNDITERAFYYPQDFTTISGIATPTIYQDMVTANVVGTPVKQESWLIKSNNSRYLTGGGVLEYKNFGGIFKPYQSYALESLTPISETIAGGFNANVLYNTTEAYQPKFSFVNYDTFGNPTDALKDGVTKMAYHWGNNHQYLIAECKNSNSGEFFSESFEEYTGASINNAHSGHYYYSGAYTTSDKLAVGYHARVYALSYWYKSVGQWVYSGELPYTGQTLTGDIDDVRIYPVDAQMTTYTYDPLSGMTSATDAKGQTTYYEYDSFQRLINIRDQNGNIIKHTDYHYANQ